MTAWCECERPDNEGDPVGMCRTCKRKPHDLCRACHPREAMAS